MLHIQERLPEVQKKILADFDLQKHTYVVPDLVSKTHIQNLLLSKHSSLPEDCVLRMSEWLTKILRREEPRMEIVSMPLVSAMIQRWIDESAPAQVRYPGSVAMVVDYMSALLPLIGSEEAEQKTRNWLQENPDALLRWGFWFELCGPIWRYFRAQNILAYPWVGPFLAGKSELKTDWSRTVYFDLGPEFSSAEYDLLQRMGRNHEFTLFVPSKKDGESYLETLWPYRLAMGLSDQVTQGRSEDLTSETKATVETFRYASQLGEVKAAVSQIRQWLESGVAPNEIGVLSTDIESYWPTLQPYFEVEGIPVQKSVVVRASTLPSVYQWLARLQIESQQLDSGSLEAAIFADESEKKIKYEKFKQFYEHIFSEKDLSRDQNVAALFSQELDPHVAIGCEQILAWSFRYLPQDSDLIESVWIQLLNETPRSTVLPVRIWLRYLSALVAKTEISIRSADPSGIVCLNLSATSQLEFKRLLILGMSEKKMRLEQTINLNQSDVRKIASDLGYYLSFPERDLNEYLVLQNLRQTKESVSLYFSNFSLAGDPEAPALFWLTTALKNKKNIHLCDQPGRTRWDELQLEKKLSEHSPRVEFDLGLRAPVVIPHEVAIRYSITQIEKYLHCPFVFTAEKLFHLSDLPSVDLDVDAMTSGRLLHAALDSLTKEPMRWNFSSGDLEKLLDEIAVGLALPIADRQLWSAQKIIYVQTIQRFLQFESEWRKDWPDTWTIGREVDIQGEWPLPDGYTVPFSGKVDRIDTSRVDSDQKKYVLLDYKSSDASYRNVSSWLNNDELQLLFYSYALESGWTNLPEGLVVGAFYYSLKKIQRKKGMMLAGDHSSLLPTESKSRNVVSEEKKQELYTELKIKVNACIDRIRQGELNPSPKDERDCLSCQWRTLCRAPHLY